jgi:hypothetical protein
MKGDFNMKIQFNTDNAAFKLYEEDGYDEVNKITFCEECNRIFDRILQRIHSGETEGKIQDINGNKIGTWSL